jgi:hypothetical protein
VSSRQAKYLLATKNQSGIGRGLRSALSGRDCTRCSSRSQCARSKQEPRIIKLRTRDLHETLQAMRKRQTTEEFRKSYAPRAGIESTHAQAIRQSGLRHTRYRCLVKTRLQHVITAVATNLLRIVVLGKRHAPCPDALLPLRVSPISCRVTSPPASTLLSPRATSVLCPDIRYSQESNSDRQEIPDQLDDRLS